MSDFGNVTFEVVVSQAWFFVKTYAEKLQGLVTKQPVLEQDRLTKYCEK